MFDLRRGVVRSSYLKTKNFFEKKTHLLFV